MVEAPQPQGHVVNGAAKEGHGQPVRQANPQGPDFTREEFGFYDGVDRGVA